MFATAILLVTISAAFVVGPIGRADAEVLSCAHRFPETPWEAYRSGSVTIEVTGISQGLADRFVQEIDLVDRWLADDIGSYSVTVCLVARDSAFDSARFESPSRRFHARSNLPERLVVLNVERAGFIAPASAYALSQHALWQNNGNAAFPVPIAKVVGQWYRARVLERIEQYHREEVLANFFDTEAFVDWTSSTQKPVQDWDPETNFSSIGDFVNFAVATYGTDVLLETEGSEWSRIEGEWRVALRNDLRERDTDTTGWIGGVALAALAIVAALISILVGLWLKHRTTKSSETPPPIPGFFQMK